MKLYDDPSHRRDAERAAPDNSGDSSQQLLLQLPPALCQRLRQHARCRCMSEATAAIDLIERGLMTGGGAKSGDAGGGGR